MLRSEGLTAFQMTGGAGHLSLCKVKGSMTFTLRRPSVREPSIKSVGIPFTQSCSISAWAYRAEAIKLLVSLMAVAPSRKA